MNHIVPLTISTLLLITSIQLPAQSVSINDNGLVAHSSAILDVNVITATAKKGILIPRMTSTQRTTIASPAQGLLVYDTNTNSFWYYNGTAWTQLATGTAINYWTASNTNIYNNNSGNVGIGLAAPKAKLHVVAKKTVVFGPDSLNNASQVLNLYGLVTKER